MFLLTQLLTQFSNYLTHNPCQVFPGPFDLRLPEYEDEKDEDAATVIQPDITIICDKSKLKGSGYFGVPDLIVEICSPSSSRIDKMTKFNRYEKAGVAEYWIVEPEGRIVSVFTLGENKRYGRPQVYSEDDSVRVNTFSELYIDLKQIFSY